MSSKIRGHVEPGFERVAEEFADNFDRRGETGAACAIYQHGRPVVDIWAGQSAAGEWTADTASVLFSVSKGVTTICLLMAVEDGLIDLDATVATYWPEYGTHGKDATTVRQLLAHQAGLLDPDRFLTSAELAAWDPVVHQLALQAPRWEPGTAYAYHALTFGWLAGEVLRRATGMRPEQWLQQRIAGPLHLRAHFGAEASQPNFSQMLQPLPDLEPIPAELIPAGHEELVDRVMTMNYSLGPSASALFETANTEEFLSIEIAGGNLVCSARDLARLYGATVADVDGIRLLRSETVRDALAPLSTGTSWLGTVDGHRWGSGFMLDSTRRTMAGPGSFGHDGAGGQLGFANLHHGLGFGYQTVRPGGHPDDRADALCRALQACL